MNVQTRWLGLLVLVALLVGCIDKNLYNPNRYLGWPGLGARGGRIHGGNPNYSHLFWTSAYYRGSEPPPFSVRFPGGRIIKSDDFTIAKLESHGAKKSLFVDTHHKEFNRTELRIKSGTGKLFANFDVQNRLLRITIDVWDGEGTVFVGDRSGRRVIPLPASRDELVELFGEPKRESP